VRFWDSSAIIATLVAEPGAETCLALAEADPAMVVWWGTAVECEAALARMVRTGQVAETAVQALRARLAQMEWREVAPRQAIRDVAASVLRRHPLKPGDALQLAAALAWSAESAPGQAFVALDRRLRKAALAEGFEVLPSP
jgi:predicted nucleic acid-binding protein